MVLPKQVLAIRNGPGMSHRLRKGAVLLILGLTTVVFPVVATTAQLLCGFYENLLPNGSAILSDWRTERGGEAVLPQNVRAMIALLRDSKVKEFRYSEAIAGDSDTLVKQRLAEGAYPIGLSTGARHRLLSASEALDPGCVALAAREGIVLARCP